MELKFSLTVDTDRPGDVRAELTEAKANGRTVIIDSFLPWIAVPAEHTEARIAAELITEAAA